LFLCAPSAATAQVCPRWQGFPQADASPGGAHRLSITGGTRGARDVRLFDANDSLVLAVSAHVTNALWAGDGEHLVAAVSPSGGAPGIYRYDLSSGRIRRIVWPDEWTDWYPDGANWFVLCRVEGDTLFYMSLPGTEESFGSEFPFGASVDSVLLSGEDITGPPHPVEMVVFAVFLLLGAWFIGKLLFNVLRYRSVKAAFVGGRILETHDIMVNRKGLSSTALRAYRLEGDRVALAYSAWAVLAGSFQPIATVDREGLDAAIRALIDVRRELSDPAA
jgi:hypothetical protein